MILDLEQIKNIILNNPNKDLVRNAQDYNKRLRMHLYGEKIETYLPLIPGFEKPAIQTLRTKYATSNKDVFSRITRPIDKIFSARGGSIYYNLSKENDAKAMAIASDVKGGLSVKKWIESYWKPHFLDDPMGFIFIEIDQNGDVYPTYKSISSVYDYQLNGTSLDYVVFEVTAQQKQAIALKKEAVIFRVVDDLFDYYVMQDGDKITVIEDQTFPNYFLHVPAILNSDIANSQTDGYISLLDEALALADKFLLKNSIKITHDFYHGFPKYWEYADDCNTCKGKGTSEGAKCPDCKGTGKRLMISVSDAKLLQYPQDKETPLVTPNVAGYVEPSDTYYKIATAELQDLEHGMYSTIWGSCDQPKTQGMSTDMGGGQKTATQIVTDQQPMIDRLTAIADAAERRHKFVVDHLIEIKLSGGYVQGGGASVNYGRRFMIESPDQVWERYSVARSKGAAISVLDDLLVEFIETKYQGDPISMAIQKKLMRLEPFVHTTISECLAIVENELDYVKKLYFGEWQNQLKNGQVIIQDEPTLREDLTAFAQKKLIEVQASIQEVQTREAKAAQDMANIRTGDRIQKTAA